MNTNPIFTDHRGRPIRRIRKSSRELRTWQKALFTLLVVTLGPLALMGAITQIDAAHQLKGVVPVANGGTGTASTLTGLMRGNSSAMTAAELSGDVTTSGSNAATVAKINGTTLGTNSAADQTIVTTASATGSWATIPNCTSGALQYATSTHLYSCGTVLTGTFADAETPTGTIDGSNAAFTLAHTPSPAGSLVLFKNGQEMIAGGADYTLATATITYTASAKPQTGDVHIAFYRW
jgi:hypothetical protein